MKLTNYILVIIQIAFAATVLTSPAMAFDEPPGFPMSLYGTVLIDNLPAPAGTVITAKVAGVDRGSVDVNTAGLYGDQPYNRLVVTGIGGEIVDLYVRNIKAKTIVFHDNVTEQEDLSVVSTPSLDVTTPAGLQRGDIVINYIVSDPDSDPVDIAVQFKGGTHATWTNATITGESNVTSSPSGISHSIIWNSAADTLHETYSDFQVRITPYDKVGAGTGDTTGMFQVDNNVPPTAIVTAPGGAQTGSVTINYILADDESDTAGIMVEFKGGSHPDWTAASVSGTLTGLVTAPAGVAHSIVWNSNTDAPHENSSDFMIRVTPSDVRQGTPGVSGSFRVDNNVPPAATVETPAGMQRGDVTLNYTLSDDESDTLSITVEFRGGSHPDWTAASVTGTSTGLGSSPAGVAHSIVWNSNSDVPHENASDFLIKITPSDVKAGTSGVSSTFHVDNNVPPAAEVETPEGVLAGDVLINYTLSDDESDTAGITVEFKGGSHPDWTAASVSGTLTGLVTAPAGVAHSIVWNSNTDAPHENSSDFMIRVTPSDVRQGTPGVSGSFRVDNNVPPAATVETPAGVQAGNIVLNYTLSDEDSDYVNISVEFKGGSYTDWTEATVVGTTTDLMSGPSGISHSIIWNSSADAMHEFASDFMIRITPSDAKTGTPGTSGMFSIDNNVPPVAVVITPVGIQTGNVVINFKLIDPESDKVNVTIEFKGGYHTTWTEATTIGNLTGLTSNQAGIDHTVTWISNSDTPSGNASDFRIRVTPRDHKNGIAGISDEFQLRNRNSVELVLKRGWNFFSVPYILKNPNASAVFAGLNYDTLFTYDDGLWVPLGSNPDIVPQKGYVIHVNESEHVINLERGLSGAMSIQLDKGFELIGTVGMLDIPAEDELYTIDDSYTYIFTTLPDEYAVGYNGPAHGVLINTTDFFMKSGHAYWILMDRDSVWSWAS